MTILYFDTETTGLDPKKHAIIQLAGIITNGKDRDEFNFNIRPYTDEPPSQFAINTHGISLETMMSYPPHQEAFEKFVALLDKYRETDRAKKIYLCGYNVTFDIDFLREWFVLNYNQSFFGRFFWPGLCVMNLASWDMVGKRHTLKNFKLTTVYEYYTGHPFEGAHDALSDIRATQEVLNKIFQSSSFFKKGKE
jgi:DNA polymerase III subunit epsilon